MVVGRPVITVIGGSSVGTPMLVEAIAEAQLAGELPPLELRLYGRAMARMARVAEHARYRLTQPRFLRDPGAVDVDIRLADALADALPASRIVLCQVRVGGYSGRASDERLAIRESVPGDEGLGPSGLACFLRGRSTIDAIADACVAHAPNAILLMMTSPLGLNVARARGRGAIQCYGVCELPLATAANVRKAVEPVLGETLTAQHAGLNHQAWLHYFRDHSGRDRTADVLRAIRDSTLVGVDPDVIRRIGAVPLPYMKYYYHTAREVRQQQARPSTRGEDLKSWAARAQQAYLEGPSPPHEKVAAILRERPMNWYEEAVVPAFAAFLDTQPRNIPLNLPGDGCLGGIKPDVIVEIPCSVSHVRVQPLPVRPLPDEPMQLLNRFIAYEDAVLSVSERPRSSEIADALRLHPLVVDTATAKRLAASILAATPPTGD